jgi:hypothetical protein
MVTSVSCISFKYYEFTHIPYCHQKPVLNLVTFYEIIDSFNKGSFMYLNGI